MQIKAAQYDLLPIHRFGISRETRTEYPTLFFRLSRKDIVGYGEAFPSGRYERSAAEHFDFLQIIEWTVFEHFFNTFQPIPFYNASRDAFEGIDSLISGFTAAYFDYFAKNFRLSVRELIGLNGLTLAPTSFTIGIDDLGIIERKIYEADAYPILKIKLGTEYDEAIIRTVRDITDKPLRVDANEAWEPEEAIEKIAWLAEQNVQLVEQPIPAGQHAKMRRVYKQSALPVFADEDCRHVEDMPILTDCYDGVNIKLDKCGGIVPALQMMQTANTYHEMVMLGCMVESSAGIAPAVALGGGADYLDLDGNLLLKNDPFDGPRANGGIFPESNPLGLGVREKENIHWEILYDS
ncbi:MAG TPA: dipeptide epimerase [bacterium]|nr:dipeptide epimerase [bacterium]